MRKVQTLVTLAVGVAMGIGVWIGVPAAREEWRSPNIASITRDYIEVGDRISESVTGHFEYDGKEIAVESPVKGNGALIGIPDEVKKVDRFDFYAQNPEGYKSRKQTYHRSWTMYE